jgi:uncharacterized protein
VTVLIAVALGFAVFLTLSLLAFLAAVRPPHLTIALEPAVFGLPAREVTIRSDDGLDLSAWFIHRPGAPAVVLLHGYPAHRADMLPLAAALNPSFSTLLLDLRSFGRSQGRVTTLGALERGDLSRAIDFLVAQGTPAVGVFGFSLGGAIAIMTAAEDPRIRAVAAYGTFADLRTLARELYGWLSILKYPLVELMVWWSRLFLGVDPTAASPLSAARTLRIPVWLAHSRADEQIPFAHAERLRGALAENPDAELHVLDDGLHGAVPEDFGERLRRFFERHLERTGQDRE